MKRNSDFPMRLQLFISRSSALSRRKAEEAILKGRVEVNNKKVDSLPFFVNRKDKVSLDFEELNLDNRSCLYMLNKPKGAVCSNFDPNESFYARDLIKCNDGLKRMLFSVGRLDKDSTGLILFTNDGELANRIIHPSNKIVKTYFVTVKEDLNKRDLLKMKDGIKLEDSALLYKIKSFEIQTKKSVLIELESGKNREIRKLFEYFGYNILSLVRLKIGSLELGDLKEGTSRKLSKSDIDKIFL